MKKSKFSETQIVSILKQGDAGVPVKDLCRQAGISPATYYQWKSKYGGMDASDLRREKRGQVHLPVGSGSRRGRWAGRAEAKRRVFAATIALKASRPSARCCCS